MMALTGFYVFAWMPTLKKRLAKRQLSGERTVEEVRRELKNMKLVILCSLVVGGGQIFSYFFCYVDPLVNIRQSSSPPPLAVPLSESTPGIGADSAHGR